MNSGSRILTFVQGGLGNQLFIYAQARSIADRTRGFLTIDPSLLSIDKVYKRPYLLNNFSIRANFIKPMRNDFKLKLFHILSKIIRNRFVTVGNWVYELNPPEFLPDIVNWNGRSVKLNGYWQSENYFVDNKLQIFNDLKLFHEEDYIKTKLAKIILQTSNSVFLHVRSYREVPENTDGSFALSVEYFRSAIEKVNELIPNPHFFLFSDDHDWVNSKLSMPQDIQITPILVGGLSVDTTLYEFFLMTLCEHGIVANSSYSWWGGWLCEQKNIMKGKDCYIFCPPNLLNPYFYPNRWNTIEF